MNACVALESLTQVCAIEGDIGEAINHLENLINILRTESDKNDPNSIDNVDNITDKDRKNIDINNNDEDEKKTKAMNDKYNEYNSKLLNVRAYYSCILSLYCYQHQHHEDIGFKLNKSFEIYEEILTEIKDKYGDIDNITFGIYLYFGLHFVQIEKWELAFQHIEYITNHTFNYDQGNNNNNSNNHNNHRNLTYDEKKLFQQLLTGFITKLLTIGDNKKSDLIMFNNAELKANCLKILQYQLMSTDDFNHEIKQRKEEKEKKEMEQKKIKLEQEMNKNNNTNHKHQKSKPKIKKEKGLSEDEKLEKKQVDEFINKQKQQNQDIIIDKNDILIDQHAMLLLHKFQDFGRVQGIINNLEQSPANSLTDDQIKRFEQIKKDLKVMQEQNMVNNVNGNHPNIDLNDGNSKSSNPAILSPQSMHHHGVVTNYDFRHIPLFNPAAPGSE